MLYYFFILFACIFLLNCAIIMTVATAYGTVLLLQRIYSLYIDYKIIELNPDLKYKLPESTYDYEDD